MITAIRVGIPVIGGEGWLGGVSHMELHVKAVTSLPKDERPQLFLIITSNTLKNFRWYQPFVSLFDGTIFVGQNLAEAVTTVDLPLIHCKNYDELFQKIDFLFPVSFDVLPHRCSAAWIHDFQHRYLPDFFSAQDREGRDAQCQKIAEHAKLIFLSSNAVKKDFLEFYPWSKAITRVLALRIYPEDTWYSGNPLEVQKKYNLPDRFVLCSNQFWVHKNHLRLFQAIALLHQAGQDIDIVCTGLTYDYRCPAYFEKLQQYINSLGISHLVHILGQIPRHDQIQLIRRSLFVVQPSLFEGLSLIVQECKTLGKSIILSNLDVHLGHQYGSYFRTTDSKDLAQKISELLTVSQPGPDDEMETVAKITALESVRNYAQEFCKLAEESQVIFNKTLDSPRTTTNYNKQTAITIATSIAPYTNLEFQKKAIDSWLALGFRTISINLPNEIEVLQHHFPNIEFVTAKKNADNNAPYIFFDDLLHCLAAQESSICGIVKSDIYLKNDKLYLFIKQQAIHSLIYGSRVDIDTIEACSNRKLSGFDYFFFDREMIPRYPQDEFCLGLPWWDLWAVLIPMAHKIPLKRLSNPIAFHAAHPANHNFDYYIPLALTLTKYFSPRFAIDKDTVDKYYYLLVEMINRSSVDITIPSE